VCCGCVFVCCCSVVYLCLFCGVFQKTNKLNCVVCGCVVSYGDSYPVVVVGVALSESTTFYSTPTLSTFKKLFWFFIAFHLLSSQLNQK